MNKNLYNHAKNLIKNISIEELQSRLQAFGIECERLDGGPSSDKILYGDIALLSSNARSGFDLLGALSEKSIDTAANDNSYALAA